MRSKLGNTAQLTTIFLGINLACWVGAFESNSISVDNNWTTISTYGYTDPVLITGVATRTETEPGVISVMKDSNGDFQVRFREWDYLDGNHSTEELPYLLLEKGHTQLTDGTVIEAGTFDLSSSKTNVFFDQSFEHAPLVFLSPQSENDTSAYSLRAEGVTQLSFSASLEEQELNDSSGHTTEEIAYIAIYNQANEGIFSDSSVFEISQMIVNSDAIPLASGNYLYLEEEQSLDTEQTHTDEIVSLLTTSSGIFGQTTTIYGGDTETTALQPATAADGTSCLDILTSNPSAPSGTYSIDTDGLFSETPFSTYCDMDFDGGGWTLVGSLYDTTATESSSAIYKGSNTVLEQSVYQSMLNSLTTGVRFVVSGDETTNTLVKTADLGGHSCHNLDSDSLLGEQYRSGQTFLAWAHNENTGCNGTGSDYSHIDFRRTQNRYAVTRLSNQTEYFYFFVDGVWKLYNDSSYEIFSVPTTAYLEIYVR